MRELAEQAGKVAAACQAMAARFRRGGKLIAFGGGGASTDAQHVAVEFVHPVIVGKPALPAISLTSDVATVTGIAARDGHGRRLRPSAPPAGRAGRYRARNLRGTGVAGRAGGDGVLAGLAAARDLGLLTVALAGGGGGGAAVRPDVDHLLVTSSDRSAHRQGNPGDHLPRAVGTGARVPGAAGGGGRVTGPGYVTARLVRRRRRLHHLLGHRRGRPGRGAARR